MAPAGPAPVVVVLPVPGADDPLYVFEASEELVVQTPFLPWLPQPAAVGAPPRVSLPLSLVVKNFFSLSPDPADLTAAQTTSVLEALPTAAFVAQLLTEYKASGLLNSVMDSALALEARLGAIAISNPPRLLMTAADVATTEPFDTPAPQTPAGRGRGRGRGQVPPPAQPAPTPGPAPLRFLSLVSLADLYQPDQTESFGSWSRLAGTLGPISTRAVRTRETSQVRTMASVMVPNINRFLGGGAAATAPDATLATNLADFLLATRLPQGLRPGRQTGNLLQREAVDGFRYRLGSQTDRQAVEAQRIFFVRPMCAHPTTFPHARLFIIALTALIA